LDPAAIDSTEKTSRYFQTTNVRTFAIKKLALYSTILMVTHNNELAQRAQRKVQMVDGKIATDNALPALGSGSHVSAAEIPPN
jgi:ABC-type thiamine transport system ATPase subunit